MKALLESLSPDDLERLIAAGDQVARLEAAFAESGDNPIRLLTKDARIVPFRHYPQGDVYDFASHSQFYYHAHRGTENGHIHVFLRPNGMPHGMTPIMPVPGAADAPCHLVAVGFDSQGRINEMFTTNRWVTGEAWYKAADIAAMLPCFSVKGGPYGRVGTWLTAVVALFRPIIMELALARDTEIDRWRHAHPDRNVLDDAELEVTSSQMLSVASWRSDLDYALKR